MAPARPSRGEVWYVTLDPTIGREQAGHRPALIVSVDRFNHGAAGLAVIVPVTSVRKDIPLHVRVEPPEGGLATVSFAKPEDIRSVSVERLVSRIGRVSDRTLIEVGVRLRVLLGLSSP